MDLIDEIKDKIKNKIIVFFDKQEISYQQKGSDYRSLMLMLLSINRKWIPTKPRNVVVSNELNYKLNNVFPNSIQKLEKHFEADFKQGNNINSHLSKNIYSADKHDQLLNHWCIHHLHLSVDTAESKNEMTNNRSDYYLLFLIDEKSVYFIDIVEHLHGDEFSDSELIKIIINNGWEHLANTKELPFVKATQFDSFNKKDTYESWKHNVNYLVHDLDGTYYNIGTAVTLSGDNIDDVYVLDCFEDCLYGLLSEENVAVQDILVMEKGCILLLKVDVNNNEREYKIINELGANRCVLSDVED